MGSIKNILVDECNIIFEKMIQDSRFDSINQDSLFECFMVFCIDNTKLTLRNLKNHDSIMNDFYSHIKE